jgi:transformation/transcription domain-associated protein
MNNKDFIKIQRFDSVINMIKGHSSCARRITIRGHDGSTHPFIVQHPAARHCRREERILQLFRFLNEIVGRRKETRRRNLSFHLPLIIPIAPQIRLVQDDPSYTTLQDIFEVYCREKKMGRDDPAVYYTNRIKKVLLCEDVSMRSKIELLNLKMELFEEISAQLVPNTILSSVNIFVLITFSIYQRI